MSCNQLRDFDGDATAIELKNKILLKNNFCWVLLTNVLKILFKDYR